MGVRVVNSSNLREEFRNINSVLRNNGVSFVSVDTEFPGTIRKSEKPYYIMNGEENYSLMRENVNALKLIQLGLAISDRHGKGICVWEFNFKDFDVEDVEGDPRDVDSIDLLKKQGIDFHTNRREGISSADFAREFIASDLGCSVRSCAEPGIVPEFKPNLTWVFFHCTYDIGYLIKMLTEPLPEKSAEFMDLVRIFLGDRIYDIKEIVSVEPFGWRSYGLDRVATNLNINRSAGQNHQAGSDSLLTLECFFAAMRVLILQRGEGSSEYVFRRFNYKLYGLEFDETLIRNLNDKICGLGVQAMMTRRNRMPTGKMIGPYSPVIFLPSYARRPTAVGVGVRVPVVPMKRFPPVLVPVSVPIYGL